MDLENLTRGQHRALIAVGIALALGLSSGLYYAVSPPPKTQVQTKTDIPQASEPKFSQEKLNLLLDSALREFAITKVCYDALQDQFLVLVGDHPHNDEWYDEGWYIMPQYKFDWLANGTALLSSYQWNPGAVHPVTDGLPCKEQRQDPKWYK